jgi:hypothetical protein
LGVFTPCWGVVCSDDGSCSVDNDDAQTESGVHESTQSNSVDKSTKSSSQQVDDVKEDDVAPPPISVV